MDTCVYSIVYDKCLITPVYRLYFQIGFKLDQYNHDSRVSHIVVTIEIQLIIIIYNNNKIIYY